MRRVIVLGSTGSIGTQALDVIRATPRRFELVGIAAGSNTELVAEQAAQFQVEHTALGAAEAEQLVRDVEADVVLNAITGSIGLGSTLAALEAGRTLALANKESLIVGGELVRAAAAPDQIVPVDSEHSALAQALRSGTRAEVRRLVVTASGGPFRGRSRADLAEVTPAQALAHPTWDMGRMVTTNSATLINKGLEVIEAHLLFDVPYDDIEVVVHPQSIVHSMVEFVDGSTIAQASPPDMRLPISLGLDWPRRQHVPRGVQRRERAGGARVPRRAAVVPRHRRHRASGRRRARCPGEADDRGARRGRVLGARHGGRPDHRVLIRARPATSARQSA